jgi:hypothetical protein
MTGPVATGVIALELCGTGDGTAADGDAEDAAVLPAVDVPQPASRASIAISAAAAINA